MKVLKNRRVLKIRVIHFVTVIALMMKSKLPPRAARGTLGSLEKKKKEKVDLRNRRNAPTKVPHRSAQ